MRIKMVAAGVCHSDMTYWNGYYENDAFPAVMGHEGGAIVESVGEGVTTVKPGNAPNDVITDKVNFLNAHFKRAVICASRFHFFLIFYIFRFIKTLIVQN